MALVLSIATLDWLQFARGSFFPLCQEVLYLPVRFQIENTGVAELTIWDEHPRGDDEVGNDIA
jgi:hypothetical protein